MDEPVQGQEPQGGESTMSPLEAHLQTVPEEQRDLVAPILKDWEKNVNGRLETAAQLEKTFGPYKEVEALTQYTPQQLEEVLGWHQGVTSTDEALDEWLLQMMDERKLTAKQQEAVEEEVEEHDLTPEQIARLVEEKAAERVQPIQEQMEEWENLRSTDIETGAISEEISRLEKEAGMDLTEAQKDIVFRLGMPDAINERGEELPVGDVSWVRKGFEMFREITAEGQRAFVNEKTNQPGAPLTAGGSAAFKPTTDFKEAREQLRERWRAQ